MPKKLDICVKSVEREMKKGKVKSFYIKEDKKIKTNPWAICKSTLRLKRKLSKKDYKLNKKSIIK